MEWCGKSRHLKAINRARRRNVVTRVSNTERSTYNKSAPEKQNFSIFTEFFVNLVKGTYDDVTLVSNGAVAPG